MAHITLGFRASGGPHTLAHTSLQGLGLLLAQPGFRVAAAPHLALGLPLAHAPLFIS